MTVTGGADRDTDMEVHPQYARKILERSSAGSLGSGDALTIARRHWRGRVRRIHIQL